MALQLISSLHEQLQINAAVEASAVSNIEALMDGFAPISIPLIVEDAARALANISIKVGSGRETDVASDINVYTAFKILASPINRNVVNVKPPLLKLLIQRAGKSPDVDNALQKLSGHPEFRDLRREVVDKFQKAAGDKEKSAELAAEIDQLRVGYSRLVDKLSTID